MSMGLHSAAVRRAALRCRAAPRLQPLPEWSTHGGPTAGTGPRRFPANPARAGAAQRPQGRAAQHMSAVASARGMWAAATGRRGSRRVRGLPAAAAAAERRERRGSERAREPAPWRAKRKWAAGGRSAGSVRVRQQSGGGWVDEWGAGKPHKGVTNGICVRKEAGGGRQQDDGVAAAGRGGRLRLRRGRPPRTAAARRAQRSAFGDGLGLVAGSAQPLARLRLKRGMLGGARCRAQGWHARR